MVERLIRPQAEVETSYRKNGVVVFILNQKNEMLLLQEAKTHDTDSGSVGQFGTCCETTEHGEDWPETVLRGLREELGIHEERLAIDPSAGVLGESLFASDVLARVVVLRWTGNPKDALSLKGDGEVKVVGWVNPKDATSLPLRPGVKKILDECLREGGLEAQVQQLLPLTFQSLQISAANLIQTAVLYPRVHA